MYAITEWAEDHVQESDALMEFSRRLIAVRTEPGVIRLLDSEDIIVIQAAGNYIDIHLDQETLLSRSTLKMFMGRLPDSFIQTHRSYIINLKYLKEIRSEIDRYSDCCMSNGKVIPLSGRYRNKILNVLGLEDDARKAPTSEFDDD